MAGLGDGVDVVSEAQVVISTDVRCLSLVWASANYIKRKATGQDRRRHYSKFEFSPAGGLERQVAYAFVKWGQKWGQV